MVLEAWRANEKSSDLQIRRTKRQIPRTNPRGTFGIWLLVLEIFLLCCFLFILLRTSPGRCSCQTQTRKAGGGSSGDPSAPRRMATISVVKSTNYPSAARQMAVVASAKLGAAEPDGGRHLRGPGRVGGYAALIAWGTAASPIRWVPADGWMIRRGERGVALPFLFFTPSRRMARNTDSGMIAPSATKGAAGHWEPEKLVGNHASARNARKSGAKNSHRIRHPSRPGP